MPAPIAVTGASGAIGGAVARQLADAGVPLRLVVRSADRAPALPAAEVVEASYGDTATCLTALSGTETVFMVSASESPTRRAEHLDFVDTAARAGVRRIVYLSFYNAGPDSTFILARDHWHTEQRIRDAGVAHTFVRDNLYADFMLLWAGADRMLRGPAGDGRVAPVARADAADAVTAVLRSAWNAAEEPGRSRKDGALSATEHDGATYQLTGPQSLTFAEVATVLTEVTGEPYSYRDETIDEAYASRAQYGAPEWMVDGWVTTYRAIAAGELAEVTDDVRRVTGHPPRSLAEVVARQVLKK